MEVLPVQNQFNVGFNADKAWNAVQWVDAAERALATRLERELRAAKCKCANSALAQAEVLLPAGLLGRVARAALALSESEPCGLRGAALFVQVEDEPLAAFNLDDSTVSTFELHLTLKHDDSGWTNMLPQFLKNLTKSGTIMISPHFTLNKKKLYRSCQD